MSGYYIKQVGMTKQAAREYNQDGYRFYGFEDTKRGYVAMFQRKRNSGFEDLRILVKDLLAGKLPRFIEMGLTQSN